MRLARYFRTSERFFLNLQTHYDIEMEKMKLGPALEREVRLRVDVCAREAPGLGATGRRAFHERFQIAWNRARADQD